MNKRIIIVAGHLAAGKTAFALRLSKELNVPCFIKDTFKEAICKSAPVTNREAGKLFSAVTFDAMTYAAGRLMEAGFPLILEGNFVPVEVKAADEEGIIEELIRKHGYGSLTFILIGDPRVLHERFTRREALPERGSANNIFSEFTYEDFLRSAEALGRFNAGGEIVNIDTTDFNAVDFDKYIEAARAFMKFGE